MNETHYGYGDIPEGVDPTVPSVGRMYDHFLNGNLGLPVDVEAARKIRERVPEVHYLANANRLFLQRAAGVIARAGIDQFIDVGAGLPTQWNTHTVVHNVNPDAHVVYVDNDPAVLAHARHLVRQWGEANVAYIDGDVADPASILQHPETLSHIDFSRPVGLMNIAIWHFVPDEANPWNILRTYLDALVSGSYLALSHATTDGQEPEKVQRLKDVYNVPTPRLFFRRWADIDKFFDGLEYLSPYEGAEPGLSYIDVWGSKNPTAVDPSHTWVPAGVARKP